MDTKSKSISYSNTMKSFAFLLVIISSLIAISSIYYIGSNQEYILNDNFEQTYQFRNNYMKSIGDIITLELELVSEDHIKNTYSNKTVQTSKLHDLKKIKARLKENVNFIYYVKNLENDKVNTNLSKSFEYLDEQYKSIYYLNSNFNSMDTSYSGYTHISLQRLDEFSYEFRSAVIKDLNPGDIFYDEYKNYKKARYYSSYAIASGIISSIIAFMCFIYLIVTAGRSHKKSQLRLSVIDKIPFEIQILVWSIVLSLEIGLFSNMYNLNDLYTLASLSLSTLAFLAFVSLLMILSITRRLKDHTFLQNFLVYKVFSKSISFIINLIKKPFEFIFSLRKTKVFKSWTLGFMLLYLIVNAILVTIITNSYGFAVFLALIVFLLFNAKVFRELYNFLDSLQKVIHASDSISYASDVKTLDLNEISPSLHELGSNIINIQSGIRKAVDKALKGEQMKTALITNVSHDLKTPLTSIITYVDLLKKEKFTSDNASNYLKILDEKSYRLKNLIEDIIEVNKASTGNMTVNKEKVNLNELVNQSMGEYEDKFSNSNLQLKINMPNEATFIEADSKSMWRILENLIENALKYSADNSRVYIDVISNDDRGMLTIKNMSKLPLDISPEQLTERFVRGDEARSSDGSGLGLSIAQSLTDLQLGDFELIIDGDLFKVLLTMPLWDDKKTLIG